MKCTVANCECSGFARHMWKANKCRECFHTAQQHEIQLKPDRPTSAATIAPFVRDEESRRKRQEALSKKIRTSQLAFEEKKEALKRQASKKKLSRDFSSPKKSSQRTSSQSSFKFSTPEKSQGQVDSRPLALSPSQARMRFEALSRDKADAQGAGSKQESALSPPVSTPAPDSTPEQEPEDSPPARDAPAPDSTPEDSSPAHDAPAPDSTPEQEPEDSPPARDAPAPDSTPEDSPPAHDAPAPDSTPEDSSPAHDAPAPDSTPEDSPPAHDAPAPDSTPEQEPEDSPPDSKVAEADAPSVPSDNKENDDTPPTRDAPVPDPVPEPTTEEDAPVPDNKEVEETQTASAPDGLEPDSNETEEDSPPARDAPAPKEDVTVHDSTPAQEPEDSPPAREAPAPDSTPTQEVEEESPPARDDSTSVPDSKEIGSAEYRGWHVGDQCMAQWTDGHHYPAVIKQIQPEQGSFVVEFPEYEETSVVSPSQVHAADFVSDSEDHAELTSTPAPSSYTQVEATALYAFTPMDDGQLSVKKDESLVVMEGHPLAREGWLFCKHVASNREGIVPRDYIHVPGQMHQSSPDFESKHEEASPPEEVKTEPESDAPEDESKFAEALYEYKADNPSCLSFASGDKLLILQDIDQHWAKASLNGQEGLVPKNRVKMPPGSRDHTRTPSSTSSQSQHSTITQPGAEQHVAIFSYTKTDDNQLSMEVGQLFNVISKDHEQWWKVSLASNAQMQGLVPVTYLKAAISVVLAKQDYTPPPEHQGVCPFKAGDRITVTDKSKDDWWSGLCKGTHGLFPSAYVVEGAAAQKEYIKRRATLPLTTQAPGVVVVEDPTAAPKRSGQRRHGSVIDFD